MPGRSSVAACAASRILVVVYDCSLFTGQIIVGRSLGWLGQRFVGTPSDP
ncbi:MAG: hypothetical protein LBJ07_01760 [Actinomycetes bacterium]|nr:hypothetical protein [Actinomycetes bacterium]